MTVEKKIVEISDQIIEITREKREKEGLLIQLEKKEHEIQLELKQQKKEAREQEKVIEYQAKVKYLERIAKLNPNKDKFVGQVETFKRKVNAYLTTEDSMGLNTSYTIALEMFEKQTSKRELQDAIIKLFDRVKIIEEKLK